MVFIIIAIGIGLYFFGNRRAYALADGHIRTLHSNPFYHGASLLGFAFVPIVAIWLAFTLFESSILTYYLKDGLSSVFVDLNPLEVQVTIESIIAQAKGGIPSRSGDLVDKGVEAYQSLSQIYWIVCYFTMAVICVFGVWRFTKVQTKSFGARQIAESNFRYGLIAAAAVAVLTTVGIFLSVIFESLIFFDTVNPVDFLFGTTWSPQTALRADQVGSSGSFGAIPLFAGTAMITVIALLVAVPIGLMSAVYLSDYAGPKVRAYGKPLLEILAGVPTVVYGFFAALTVAPFIRNTAEGIGLSASSESALAAGVVMGIMIIPFISSLSDDVINAVPQSMRDGSYGLGATKSETIRRVILPAALPGIVSAVLLAVSRAVGETMIVVMAAGQGANLTANPLEAVTTVTVQIVALLTGDTEFDSPKTLAAFALGLVLFLVTLSLNIYALRVVKRYREQYD